MGKLIRREPSGGHNNFPSWFGLKMVQQCFPMILQYFDYCVPMISVRSPFHIMRFLSVKLPITLEAILENEIHFVALKAEKKITILDLGAGPARYWNTKSLSLLLKKNCSKLTLLDASDEFDNEDLARKIVLKRINGLVPKDLEKFDENEFDLVVALDVIEHLPKHEGYILLYHLDRIARFSSLVSTTTSFVWQPPANNNPYNAHISEWRVRELKTLGWKARNKGQTGFKFFYGPYAVQKYRGRNWLILEFIALSKILSYPFPRLAFLQIAIKRKKNLWIKIQK